MCLQVNLAGYPWQIVTGNDIIGHYRTKQAAIDTLEQWKRKLNMWAEIRWVDV